MSAPKMHADEVPIDQELVGRLLRAQFPPWSGLPIAPPLKTGTDNAVFRLGTDMSVRLPRIAGAEAQIHKEQRWLAYLAPHLPLRVPVPLATGVPAEGYPFAWAVHPWFEGREVVFERLSDPVRAAKTLAAFLRTNPAIVALSWHMLGEVLDDASSAS